MKPPKAVKDLTDVFEKLPGIGPRTAARLTYFLVNQPDSLAKQLAAAAAKKMQSLVGMEGLKGLLGG